LSVTDTGTRVPDDWYVGFHRGLAARFWRAAGAAMLDADEQVVRRLLGPEPGSVLDAPCGDGRLTIRLAAAGWTATGVDIVEEEVAHARAAAAQARVTARFEVGDLRALPDLGRVDAVLSWGNSFGYLLPHETARSLAGLFRALRPGGRLVLQSMTVAEALLPGGIEPRLEHEFGGIRMAVVNRYRAEESRLEGEFVFADAGGNVERASAAHHVHTTGEVVRMLRAAGFAGVELLDGDGERPYALGDGRMIAVAIA